MYIRISFFFGGYMNKQENYLITFLTDISFCTSSVINVESDEFKQLLLGFINTNYANKRKLMDKIFDISIEGNQGKVNFNFSNIIEYGSIYDSNPGAYIKILDEIGYKDTDEILLLASSFVDYVKEINSIGKKKVRKDSYYERRKRNKHE